MSMMKNSIQKLIYFGWSDRTIAKYLMIKPRIVKYYRKKNGINKDAYQDFYGN